MREPFTTELPPVVGYRGLFALSLFQMKNSLYIYFFFSKFTFLSSLSSSVDEVILLFDI